MKTRLKIPISFKLTAFTLALLAGVAVLIAFNSADLFEEITVRRETHANLEQAQARATEVEHLIVSYVDKIKVVAGLLLKDYQSEGEKKSDLNLTFYQDRDLISVEVIGRDNSIPKRVVNNEYLETYKLDETYIDRIRSYQKAQDRFNFDAVFAGQLEVKNSTLKGGAPTISVGVPLVRDQFGNIMKIAVGEIKLERIQKIFGKAGVRTSYLIDKEGQVISHPNEEMVFNGQGIADLPIVQSALESKLRSQQKVYFNKEKNERFIAAFSKVPAGVAVIIEVPESVILEGARQVKREAFFLTAKAISLAIFLIVLLSVSMTVPLEKLVEVTKEIGKGNFDVDTNIKSRDEVGELAEEFTKMVGGLRERDKMKNVLDKFHGSSVADDLVQGNLQLGGSRKEVTVFFSDIRDFTKFSEGHTAEEVVDMLNEYFHVMVGIINKHGGVVDKFIGDAIMAVWGVPKKSNHDAKDAVNACLEMRKGLMTLNEKRIAEGKVPIKIGIGLHSGEAISGNIGSDERMEYTVIGDSVNQAARIEASTKAFGTDLLISDTVFEETKESFIIEKAGEAEVKGKEKPLSLFKVRGYIDNGQQVIVKTPYSDYEAGDADKVKVTA